MCVFPSEPPRVLSTIVAIDPDRLDTDSRWWTWGPPPPPRSAPETAPRCASTPPLRARGGVTARPIRAIWHRHPGRHSRKRCKPDLSPACWPVTLPWLDGACCASERCIDFAPRAAHRRGHHRSRVPRRCSNGADGTSPPARHPRHPVEIAGLIGQRPPRPGPQRTTTPERSAGLHRASGTEGV